MNRIQQFLLLLIVFTPFQIIQAITVVPSGTFDLTEGTLSGLAGTGFSASFNYDTSNVTGSYNFGPNLGVYGLDTPASTQLTVDASPGLSFSTNTMGIWVENDHLFDGFDWIPAGLSDFLWITGLAPGASYDLSTNTITDGLAVSYTYVGDSSMLTDTNLPNDLTNLNFGSVYGGFMVLDEYQAGNIVGSAYWNLGGMSSVPEPGTFLLLIMGMIGIRLNYKHTVNKNAQ